MRHSELVKKKIFYVGSRAIEKILSKVKIGDKFTYKVPNTHIDKTEIVLTKIINFNSDVRFLFSEGNGEFTFYLGPYLTFDGETITWQQRKGSTTKVIIKII